MPTFDIYRVDRGRKIAVVFLFGLITFRATLAIFLGSLTADILLSIALASAAFLLMLHCVVKGFDIRRGGLYFFIGWCIVLFILYGLIADVGSILVPIIGFFNVCGMLVFFIYVYRTSVDRGLLFSFCKSLIVYLGLLNAFAALVQYFVSEDLFGFVSNAIYADAEVVSRPNVEKRAISFIASPQSLSLFLAFTLVLIPSVIKSQFLALTLYLIVFFAGILTVSKAFFVFILVFYVFFNLNVRGFIYLIAICLIVFVAFSYLPVDSKLGRVAQLSYFVENYQQYSAYVIWYDSIMYVDDLISQFVGKGLGVFSRGGQSIANYTLLHGSTESYFIQLYVETGLVGLGIFLVLVTSAYIRLLRIDRHVACALIGICTIGLFTPAPYGFVCGILMHFCIVSAFYVRRSNCLLLR